MPYKVFDVSFMWIISLELAASLATLCTISLYLRSECPQSTQSFLLFFLICEYQEVQDFYGNVIKGGRSLSYFYQQAIHSVLNTFSYYKVLRYRRTRRRAVNSAGNK
uniref:Putative secreted protein n=1 Tax=Panstrongylus lignarius TaxID=156445 RepID=A0A224Y136_9HEMI